jgi:cytidine deaminase
MPLKGNAAPAPCPSEQAYRRHLAHGEEPCEGCRQAHREYGAAHRPPAQSTSGVHIGKRPLGPGECGTRRGYRWHLKQREEPCQACKDVIAEYARSRHGKAVGTQPGRALLPCGTDAAYKRHQQHGEDPCAECRAAHRAVTAADRKASRILAAMMRAAP